MPSAAALPWSDAAMTPPEVAALHRTAAGDPAAWAQVVEAHAAAMHRLCFGLTGDEHLAADAVQEAFLRIRRHARQFRGSDAATAERWVLAIAANCARMHLRAARRRQRLHADAPRPVASEDQDEALAAVRLALAALTRNCGSTDLTLEWQPPVTAAAVEVSLDLSHWSTVVENAQGGRWTGVAPFDSRPSFFRLRLPTDP